MGMAGQKCQQGSFNFVLSKKVTSTDLTNFISDNLSGCPLDHFFVVFSAKADKDPSENWNTHGRAWCR